MAPPKGDDTASLLCEGDFLVWKGRLTDLLATHGLSHHVRKKTSTARRNYSGKAQAAAALDMTTALVPPHLIRRVPSTHCNNLFRLMESIEARAQPFRFLDFPPELRDRTYAYTLPEGSPVGVKLALGCWLEPRRNAIRDSSAITKVSRQLREESLGLYFFELAFLLACMLQGRLPGRRQL